ncbi:DUF169 domain-containing protein [Candidatus Bathyarchaeota archaeon]|nr:DUF169 domain-containing protein [Candidatus Bathyarchaeota archaeon]TFH16507.1 MAG: hypothetical protein E4H04_06485 [Candidatus Bathyarchaeota archaeon]
MNETIKKFKKYWQEHFNNAELPIAAYYTDEDTVTENKTETGHCLIANLNRVRNGTPLRFSVKSIGCPGGRRYTGFSHTMSDDFEYFLSCGIPGRVEGERYKKSPELVRKLLQESPKFTAPKQYLVFKRLDQLTESETPDIVIFFATPDVLSGLFTLANFDYSDEGVVAPFGSGCSSIIMHPYLEGLKDHPRCVFGMFDPSARPYVASDTLTFAIPMNRFTQMVENIPESFLITPTWTKIKKRIPKSK